MDEQKYILFIQDEDKVQDIAVFSSSEPIKDMNKLMYEYGVAPSYDKTVGIRAAHIPPTDAVKRKIQKANEAVIYKTNRKKPEDEPLTLEEAGLEEVG